MKTSLSHARHSCARAGTDEHTQVFAVDLAQQRGARTGKPTMSVSTGSTETMLGQLLGAARCAEPFPLP